jgi:hypothetical protein
MANPASDYHRGDMDIHEQAKTYAFVMGLTKWGCLALAASLLFLVLWFCTGTGFLGALVTGLVVTALGVVVLRDGGDAH